MNIFLNFDNSMPFILWERCLNIAVEADWINSLSIFLKTCIHKKFDYLMTSAMLHQVVPL